MRPEAEKARRRINRGKGEIQIIFRQADPKNRHQLKLAQTRRCAKRRYRATRRDKRYFLSDFEAVTLSQARANGDGFRLAQISQIAFNNIALQAGQLLQFFNRQAAQQNTARRIARRQHGLPVHQRRCQHHALDLLQPCRQCLAIDKTRFIGANGGVAVNAQYPVEQIGAKTGHHSHHDNQRRDPQHNAQKGNTGDDGNKALPPLGA